MRYFSSKNSVKKGPGSKEIVEKALRCNNPVGFISPYVFVESSNSEDVFKSKTEFFKILKENFQSKETAELSSKEINLACFLLPETLSVSSERFIIALQSVLRETDIFEEKYDLNYQALKDILSQHYKEIVHQEYLNEIVVKEFFLISRSSAGFDNIQIFLRDKKEIRKIMISIISNFINAIEEPLNNLNNLNNLKPTVVNSNLLALKNILAPNHVHILAENFPSDLDIDNLKKEIKEETSLTAKELSTLLEESLGIEALTALAGNNSYPRLIRSKAASLKEDTCRRTPAFSLYTISKTCNQITLADLLETVSVSLNNLLSPDNRNN